MCEKAAGRRMLMVEIAEVRACVSGREVLDGGTGSERDERSFVKVAVETRQVTEGRCGR